MNHVRAIIFDVYKTILEVCETPLDAEKRWRNLLVQTFGSSVEVSLEELANRCRHRSRRSQGSSRARNRSSGGQLADRDEAGIAKPRFFV